MAEKKSRTSRISAVVQRRMPSVLRMDSIKSQIVVFALLGALIPSVTMAWVSYVQNKRALTEKITGELKSASAQTAREMDIWLKERLYDVRVFASSYEVSENALRVLRAGGPGAARLEALTRLRDYLNSVQERFPTDYDELLFLDPEGEVVATSSTESGAAHLPDGWQLDAEGDRTIIGDPYWDAALGHAGMAIAVPVRAAGGPLLGALTATLNFAAVGSILRSFLENDNGVLYLITRDGRVVLTSSETSPAIMDSRLAPGTLAALRTDSLGVLSYTSSAGVDVIGALAPIPRLEWATIAEVSQAEAFSPVTRLRNVTVGIVFLLLLGVGLIAYRLGLLMARPLDRLTRGAGEVAKGDLAVDTHNTVSLLQG